MNFTPAEIKNYSGKVAITTSIDSLGVKEIDLLGNGINNPPFVENSIVDFNFDEDTQDNSINLRMVSNWINTKTEQFCEKPEWYKN